MFQWLVAITFFGMVTTESLAAEVVKPCTLVGEITDVVGPATYDYFQRLTILADQEKCGAIHLRINTPGGSLQSTRKIVELIVNSNRPVLCLIYPSGGHAGSAGAIIMQACHVSGGMEATNIGAATPVSAAGEDIPEDLKKKLFSDTRSWVEGLAKLRERNVEFATQIVLDAKSLDAREAAKQGAIDRVVSAEHDFLAFAEGRMVKVGDGDNKTAVVVGPLVFELPDLRHDLLQILSDPQWAYLLFMASLGLLYFELTHPGVFLPGVVGAIGLVISLVNFHMLEVSWGAAALIALGLLFIFAELFVPSFGALGLGGMASVVLGSFFLFDFEQTGLFLPSTLIAGVTLVFGLLTGTLTYLAYTAIARGQRNRQKADWVGKNGEIKTFHVSKRQGMVWIEGELWRCRSQDNLQPDDVVKVEKIKGLTLEVSKA